MLQKKIRTKIAISLVVGSLLAALSIAHANSYTDNGDGTVSDSATGLMWQKSDAEIEVGWQDAIDYCDGLELAGCSTWSLPTREQLKGLVVCTNGTPTPLVDGQTCETQPNIPYDSPTIDPVFDITSNSMYRSYFWTNDEYQINAAWYVNFIQGPIGQASKESKFNVRCTTSDQQDKAKPPRRDDSLIKYYFYKIIIPFMDTVKYIYDKVILIIKEIF